VFVMLYLAGYLVRHAKEIRTKMIGFLKPMAVFGVIALLLLLEPDFGAVAVIMCAVLGVMFLAGVRLREFSLLFLAVCSALGLLVISSPYRLQRFTAFLHPWVHQFDSGYQLTQSLIAFGRGGIFGVGLGNSIQKLFYLPEAHTDFLFAVLSEELGLVGGFIVIALFVALVSRIFMLARRAYQMEKFFEAYLSYGFGLLISLQVLINIGVNVGMLPTKGLTLPFPTSARALNH